eukprot:jgi/Astpho2/934/Aster-00771
MVDDKELARDALFGLEEEKLRNAALIMMFTCRSWSWDFATLLHSLQQSGTLCQSDKQGLNHLERSVDRVQGASAGPAEQAVVAFAALIRSGADFPTEWYNLRDGVFFLGDEDFGSQLKIKQAYMDLYEFLERKNHKDRPVYQQVVVSGNPGVGKSMFLVYYLLRWTQAVVAHSPRAKDYKQFLRSPRSIGEVPIILPPWEQDEVLDLRQVVYPEMSTEQALERLARRNGIPRAIFHDPTDEGVLQALAQVPFTVLIEPDAVSDTPFRQAHPLIVFHPTKWHQWRSLGLEAFVSRKALFTSNWVRRLATEHFACTTAKHTHEWLPATGSAARRSPVSRLMQTIRQEVLMLSKDVLRNPKKPGSPLTFFTPVADDDLLEE